MCEESESLKSQVKSGAGGGGGDSEGYMRLKAENAALQKTLHGTQLHVHVWLSLLQYVYIWPSQLRCLGSSVVELSV